MSDNEQRDLERVWRATKDDLDAERYLRARLANYDFPLRKMIETTIRSDRLMTIGVGAEERPVTAGNVIEYLLQLPVSVGAQSEAEREMARMERESRELAARMRTAQAGNRTETTLAEDLASIGLGPPAPDSARAETQAFKRPAPRRK